MGSLTPVCLPPAGFLNGTLMRANAAGFARTEMAAALFTVTARIIAARVITACAGVAVIG